MFFFFNDTATTEIYTSFPTRRSSDLGTAQASLPSGSQGLWDPTHSSLSLLSPWSRSHQTSALPEDRKSTRLNSSHANISYAVFCLKKKKSNIIKTYMNNKQPK